MSAGARKALTELTERTAHRLHPREPMNMPTWWTEAHTSSWEQVKEALRRDWTQTKHDLHMGGHELNQTAMDTLGQTVGESPLPAPDRPNPPTIIGQWEDAEAAISFGYAARTHYGDRHPTWSGELARTLKHDWKSESKPWSTDVESWVRYGYEIRH